jgi:hypothetical protein
MSWNNIIPWQWLAQKIVYWQARQCCAFEDEVHVTELREDWL